MEQLFDYYDPYEFISYEAQITLSIHGIKFLLRDYPNQTFIDILIGVAKHGAKIGYTKSLSKIRLRNPSPLLRQCSYHQSSHLERTTGRTHESNFTFVV
jgi:hypothetical protein